MPPNGRPDGDDASGTGSGLPAYPPPPPGPPPAFDDDALAAALEADIAPYTQPIPVIPPAAPAAPPPTEPPPAEPPPAAAAPAPTPAPYVEPQPEYQPPDVPEYIVPPAPPAPAYEVPPAPPFDAPPTPEPYDLPVEPGGAASGPSTLDAIGRLEEQLLRREQGLPPLGDPDGTSAPPLDAPPPAAEPADLPPTWEPALDHPAPGHVFPSPYQPFTDPVTVTPPAAEPSPEPLPPFDDYPPGPLPGSESLPPLDPFPPAEPAAPAPPVDSQSPFSNGPGDWQSAPPPSFEPPPLVEPPAAAEPPSTPPPTEGAVYVEPTVLPPLQREVRLEDVQGLPPPVGMQAAPIPPYDPNAPIAPPDPFAVPPVSPAQFGGPYATPVDAPAPGYPPSPLDENDDAVDDVDRILGADALPVTAPSNDELFAPPSQPIATQRLREGEPGIVGEKPQNHPVFVVENAAVEPTALDLRAGRSGRLFWLWFAVNSSVLSVAIGAVLFTLGMSLRQAIVATLAGVAISFLPLGLGTLAGKWSGQPTMVVSRATFGHVGNVLPAIVAVLVRVFWGGVLLWLLGLSSARLLVFAGIDAGLGEAVWTYVVIGIGFLIAAVIAIFGYGFVARVQLIASILSGLLIAGVIVMTYPRLDIDVALATGDGPWMLVLGGAVIVFSFVGLAWVQASSDIARYQRPASSGAASMLWATVGRDAAPVHPHRVGRDAGRVRPEPGDRARVRRRCRPSRAYFPCGTRLR